MNLIVLLLMLLYTFVPLFFNFFPILLFYFIQYEEGKYKKYFRTTKHKWNCQDKVFFFCILCFLFYMINVCRNRHNKEYMAQIRTRNCMAVKEKYSILLHTSLISSNKRKICLGKNINSIGIEAKKFLWEWLVKKCRRAMIKWIQSVTCMYVRFYHKYHLLVFSISAHSNMIQFNKISFKNANKFNSLKISTLTNMWHVFAEPHSLHCLFIFLHYHFFCCIFQPSSRVIHSDNQ
jgi:hypothetical protein